MPVSNNNRIFYACQGVEIDDTPVEGVTSVSLNTSIDFEQVFQFGVLEIFENIEGVVSADLTIEKFIASGLNTVSIGAFACAANDTTKKGSFASVSPTSASVALNKMALCRSNYKVFLLPETNTALGGTIPETGISYKLTSGNITEYSISQAIEGPTSESVTISSLNTQLVVNDTIGDSSFVNFSSNTAGVVRRQNVRHSGYRLGAQSVSYSVSLGSEDLFELGRKQPYARVATFPAEVSAEITYLASQDFKATPAFVTSSELDVTTAATFRTYFGPVGVSGDGFRLTSTSFGGGDAGGGNATITESYQTFNSLAVWRRY